MAKWITHLSLGVPLGILGRGALPDSLNLDPISDQKSLFPHPFSEKTNKGHKHDIHVYTGRNFVIVT